MTKITERTEVKPALLMGSDSTNYRMQTPPKIPDTLHELMAKIGPIWGSDTKGHVQLMIEKFTEVLRWSPKDGVSVDTIKYGSHARQAFEIFRPIAQAKRLRPALIFVHGGAFTEGSRHRSDEIYANVLYYFAQNDVVGFNVGYRLAPDARYPHATYDIADVVAWVKKNANRFDIDPARIFIMGHSAGAAHVGTFVYDKRLQPGEGHGLAGVFIISGRVRADARDDNPNAKRVIEYYGSDASRYDDMSPVSHVDRESPPTFIACAEFENPLIDTYCFELAYRLALTKGKAPPFMWLKGHNHTSIIAHFNTEENSLGQACLAFIEKPTP